MKHLDHAPGLILVALVALLGLSACGSHASAPPAATSASTAAAIAGDFAGKAGQVDAIGLSTDGHQLIAYTCDGTTTHAATFAVPESRLWTDNYSNLFQALRGRPQPSFASAAEPTP